MVKRTILFLVIAFGIIGFAFYEATGVRVKVSRENGKTVLNIKQPPKPLSADELKACNRKAEVYVEKPSEPPKPAVEIPKLREVDEMKPGQDGYVAWVAATTKGSLYLMGIQEATQTPGHHEGKNGDNNYRVHILMTEDGIKIDCDSETLIIPDEFDGSWGHGDDHMIIGQFRAGKATK